MRTLLLLLAVLPLAVRCDAEEGAPPDGPQPPAASVLFTDVTATHLPGAAVRQASMDAQPADLDGDGDLDLAVACEFCPNLLLINDGAGRFTDESAARLPRTSHDSEDIAVADFDEDGDLDLVFVSEDDQTNELFLNDGLGTFADASDRLPVRGTSNAVLVADLDGDGHADLLIGNNGQNAALLGDGTGHFTDATELFLPTRQDVTQDLERGDVNGDGHPDLVVGNEDTNRLLINDGSGRLVDETAARLPARAAPEETREADLGDVDGDGDLDLVFANVNAFVPGADPQNRLLINDGSGTFTDATGSRLPAGTNRSFDADFIDVDGDGDLDLVTADARQGSFFDEPVRVFENDGAGLFVDATARLLPPGVVGKWFDAEAADFDGDGRLDLYLASQRSTDRLLMGR